MARFMKALGIAFALLGMSAQMAGAVLVQAPAYLNTSGSPVGALGFICLNLDGSSCSFGGGGGGGASATATAAAPTYTEAATVNLSTDLSGYLRTLPKTAYSAGSSTSGQLGQLNFCAILSAAPTYTTGQTNFARCDTHGSFTVLNVDSTGTALDPNAPTPAGTNIIGALVANQSVNNAQVNGVAVSTGNGVAGTGVQRVTIASDNTAFMVNLGTLNGAALAANQVTNAAQGSTTSGQTGELAQAKTNSSATGEAYTTATTNPLSAFTNGEVRMGGGVLAGNTDSGAPVKFGGRYSTTLPTLTNGQRGDAQLTVQGTLRTTNAGYPNAGQDGNSNNYVALGRIDQVDGSGAGALMIYSHRYNSITNLWDRDREINDTAASNGVGVSSFATPPLSVAAAAIVPDISASSAATSLVQQASPANYYDGYCQSSAAGRCILYNATTAPAAGALTASLVLECAVVTAGGQGGWQYNLQPRRGSVGLVILFSSSADCNTYTVSSTAYIHGSHK